MPVGKRRLVIAGATGSIGTQAIDVLEAVGDVEVVGLAAGRDAVGLLDCQAATGATAIALASQEAAAEIDRPAGVELIAGPDAAARLVESTQPDLVLNAVVGFAGLAVSVAALESGCDLALANKESLVAGGDLLGALADASGSELIPVDSEHASLAQLLDGTEATEISSITITASGGPFRGRSRAELEDVTVGDALAHPTWAMGGKITIDSATLMNKGLEVIEAHHLFGVDYDRIDVVVHPQSIVHGFVHLADGMALAHMGLPDMRSPIAWALAGRRRPELPIAGFDPASVGVLGFEAPDEDTFPCLRLAREAGRAGGTAPTVLNAANEVAVDAFLEERIGFLAIADVVAATLEEVSCGQAHDLESVAEADRRARESAAIVISGMDRR